MVTWWKRSRAERLHWQQRVKITRPLGCSKRWLRCLVYRRLWPVRRRPWPVCRLVWSPRLWWRQLSRRLYRHSRQAVHHQGRVDHRVQARVQQQQQPQQHPCQHQHQHQRRHRRLQPRRLRPGKSRSRRGLLIRLRSRGTSARSLRSPIRARQRRLCLRHPCLHPRRYHLRQHLYPRRLLYLRHSHLLDLRPQRLRLLEQRLVRGLLYFSRVARTQRGGGWSLTLPPLLSSPVTSPVKAFLGNAKIPTRPPYPMGVLTWHRQWLQTRRKRQRLRRHSRGSDRRLRLRHRRCMMNRGGYSILITRRLLRRRRPYPPFLLQPRYRRPLLLLPR